MLRCNCRPPLLPPPSTMMCTVTQVRTGVRGFGNRGISSPTPPPRMHFLFGKMLVHNQKKGASAQSKRYSYGTNKHSIHPPTKTYNQSRDVVEDIWRFGQRRLDSFALIHQYLNMIRTNRTVHGWSLWLLNHHFG